MTPDDLEVLFRHQSDPVANQMAAFPARDRAAFMEHWTKILADRTGMKKIVIADGIIAGNAVSSRATVDGKSGTGSEESTGVEA